MWCVYTYTCELHFGMMTLDDATISSFLFYAPLALYFVYAENEVDIQLLANQQNWQLLYANLEKDTVVADRPASALFVHQAQKLACFAIRGTASTNDVVTDIRAIPVPFPDESISNEACSSKFEDDWTPIIEGKGLALCGMVCIHIKNFLRILQCFYSLLLYLCRHELLLTYFERTLQLLLTS